MEATTKYRLKVLPLNWAGGITNDHWQVGKQFAMCFILTEWHLLVDLLVCRKLVQRTKRVWIFELMVIFVVDRLLTMLWAVGDYRTWVPHVQLRHCTCESTCLYRQIHCTSMLRHFSFLACERHCICFLGIFSCFVQDFVQVPMVCT